MTRPTVVSSTCVAGTASPTGSAVHGNLSLARPAASVNPGRRCRSATTGVDNVSSLSDRA